MPKKYIAGSATADRKYRMASLNQNQQAAVLHKDGPLMVLAGPGSGKTTVISHRTLQLVKSGVPPWQILVITFSKAAAVEMESRFRHLAKKSLGEDASCTFGTFHAIFFRILRQRYGYSLDHVLQEGQRREIINNLLKEAGIAADEDMQIAVRDEISLVKNELHELDYYSSKAMGTEEFRAIYMQYEEVKRANSKIDFDDMLILCYNLWKAEPNTLALWQKKFPYIMIDEFQDINQVQYECVRLLSAHPHNLCIVGDDDQSIYRFRGAKPEFLLRFPEDFPGTTRILLDTNYRSSDRIIAFSNRLISQNKVRYDKTIIGTDKIGPRPIVINSEDQNTEAAYIAEQIRKAPDLNEIAVVYRVNMQARAFVDAFLQANIPYVAKDEISIIYEHWLAQDIFAYLRLCRGLAVREDLERVINKPFRYISKAFLQKARKDGRDIFRWYAESGMLNSQQMQRIEELISHLRQMGKRNTTDAIRWLRRYGGYDDHIKDHCEYRKLNPTGLYEIASELQEAAAQFPEPEDFLSHCEEAIANKNSKAPEGARVTLSTLHSAKGLEFDTVYIAGAVEGLIPHDRSKTAAELEEECRLFYVGATRARKNLFISVIKKRHEKKAVASRFIKRLKKR